MVPAVVETWNFSQTEKRHPVRFPVSQSTSSPLKRHLLEDMKSEKKIKKDSSGHVDHSKNVSSEENQEGISDISAKVENYLQIYNQFKSSMSSKNQKMDSYMFETIGNDLQFNDNTALRDCDGSFGERKVACIEV